MLVLVLVLVLEQPSALGVGPGIAWFEHSRAGRRALTRLEHARPEHEHEYEHEYDVRTERRL